MAFDLSSYVEVKDRISEFYMGHPQGTIRTFLVKHEGKEVVFEARVYRTNEEAIAGIYTSGFARELEGDGMVNKTSHVENCETSAIGRALANLNYCGSIAGAKAPRPSREEMGKAERMGGGETQTNGSDKATEKQLNYAAMLLQSSVFTEDERDAIAKSVAKNSSKSNVSRAIDRMQEQIKERQALVPA